MTTANYPTQPGQITFIERKPNHILHLMLSFVTIGIWFQVWAAIAIYLNWTGPYQVVTQIYVPGSPVLPPAKPIPTRDGTVLIGVLAVSMIIEFFLATHWNLLGAQLVWWSAVAVYRIVRKVTS